jgi:hypothetical protein
MLRVLALVQSELADQLLAQMAATALGKQRVARVQFHAAHEAVFVLALGADAHIAGGNTPHRAVLGVQDFGGREPRVDLDAEVFCLLGEPAAHVAHGDDVIAFVVRGLGDCEIGQLGRGLRPV